MVLGLPAITIIYVLGCLIVGWLGRNRVVKFPGIFILSILLTPPFIALALYVSASKGETG